jgi:threonylcarbamoyladenosine tRNA methylthiotransferase MtaB
VINTCSVTENADKRFKTIVKHAQKANEDAFVIAVGCYAQLKPEELADVEGVDLVLGCYRKIQDHNILTISKTSRHRYIPAK